MGVKDGSPGARAMPAIAAQFSRARLIWEGVKGFPGSGEGINHAFTAFLVMIKPTTLCFEST
jgi:hypothetical protein